MVTIKYRLPYSYWLLSTTMGKPRGRSPNSSLVVGVPATNADNGGKIKALSVSSTAKRLSESSTPSEVSAPEGGLSSKEFKTQSQLSHHFNAYAESLNHWYGRTGSVFEHPFKRTKIEDQTYLNNALVDMPNNPVHHGFCSHPRAITRSPYLRCRSDKASKLMGELVKAWFESFDALVQQHEQGEPDAMRLMASHLKVEPDCFAFRN